MKETDQISLVFGALSDPTRRAILTRLTEGDATVAELAAPFSMSQPAISRHLKVLERAGLLTRTRRATARLSHLEAEPLREVTTWLARGQDAQSAGGSHRQVENTSMRRHTVVHGDDERTAGREYRDPDPGAQWQARVRRGQTLHIVDLTGRGPMSAKPGSVIRRHPGLPVHGGAGVCLLREVC